jgi:hypothetical protein
MHWWEVAVDQANLAPVPDADVAPSADYDATSFELVDDGGVPSPDAPTSPPETETEVAEGSAESTEDTTEQQPQEQVDWEARARQYEQVLQQAQAQQQQAAAQQQAYAAQMAYQQRLNQAVEHASQMDSGSAARFMAQFHLSEQGARDQQVAQQMRQISTAHQYDQHQKLVWGFVQEQAKDLPREDQEALYREALITDPNVVPDRAAAIRQRREAETKRETELEQMRRQLAAFQRRQSGVDQVGGAGRGGGSSAAADWLADYESSSWVRR